MKTYRQKHCFCSLRGLQPKSTIGKVFSEKSFDSVKSTDKPAAFPREGG